MEEAMEVPEMITLSWTTIAGFALLVVAVGPGFYWIGRLSQRVEVNSRDIGTIFAKIDAIHKFVKNGGKNGG